MPDPIKTAKRMFGQYLSKADPASMPGYDPQAKDRQAQAAGRKGGMKGGQSRAIKLSSAKRSKIAKKAAIARWKS